MPELAGLGDVGLPGCIVKRWKGRAAAPGGLSEVPRCTLEFEVGFRRCRFNIKQREQVSWTRSCTAPNLGRLSLPTSSTPMQGRLRNRAIVTREEVYYLYGIYMKVFLM